MTQSSKDKVHGEGNYEASRKFDKAESDFVKSGKVEEAKGKAAPKSKAEEEEMKRAEEAGRARAKGEDPALKRPASMQKNK